MHAQPLTGTSSKADLHGSAARLRESIKHADMAAAMMLQFVRPAPALAKLMSPEHAHAFANERLAESFGDLLEWRDGLLAKHWKD
jgi:glutathione S-transferase